MMSSRRSETISHRGKVIDVTPELTTVEIVSQSACSACHAKSLCSLGESVVKKVEVPTRPYHSFKPGDEVNVLLRASMGHKAVVIAYGLPLVVLIAVLLICIESGLPELFSGLAAIGSVALYYFVIWLLRGRLRNSYEFEIREL